MQVVPQTPVPQDSMPLETLTLDVTGMKCAGCVQAVERQLIQQPGVRSACVNLVTAVAAVEYESGAVNGTQLAEKLTESGFPSQLRSPENLGNSSLSPQHRYQQELKAHQKELAIAASLLLLSFTGHGFHDLPLLSSMAFHWGLATLALLFPGRNIIIEGARGLWNNSPNMNSLVGLGAIAAYTTSTIALLVPQTGWECFFDEPVMLLGFILLGRTLEARARSQAAADLSALLALQPKRAHLIPVGSTPDETPVDIAAETVKVGEWLRVLPGERFPVDGRVVGGETTVNESMITGEAIPVPKQAGDLVSAGTVNDSGLITLETTRIGSDTTLGQIIQWVENAQTRKAPIQQLADTVAGYFVYGIMTIATLTFLFWELLGVQLWPHVLAIGETPYSPVLLSLKLAIAVLVIACPCALGLATPTAILVGTGIGAKQGILIKGGQALQQLNAIDVISFDKTGTLTQGSPVVTDCIPNPALGWSSDRLLGTAAAVEQGTNHPLARAILDAAQKQELTLPSAESFQTFPGYGVQAWVEQQRVQLGTPEWLAQQDVILPANTEEIDQLAQEGKTVVAIALNGQWAGWLGIIDPLRPQARETLETLRQMGLSVMMLTGDRQATAHAVGEKLGLSQDEIQAEVKPEAKAEAIARLQKSARVAMVGDGINDGPALAQADVGIALQSATEVAMDTAQLVLIGDRLADIPHAIALGRDTFSKIRQNLFWAFAYNILAIPLAAGVFLPQFGILLSPATAGAFMAFSSVSVVTNSLLLRRRYPT
ncbi:heavy metal translocating P-type ATPase [Roseofilum reptotaenium CS-1145]|uniref:Copper-translocating P-type ATPase n=1 Tax=Roseofilum reptotaenium AO1-A TaxID=1925591 RepID=A0A1L9QV24_9CYAN|nr:heavy metal translocating P-type ATPase [Roseofilum reptotaenium]MDB9518735.1 heavy metal translocating P-type ATPase [Roseofilum reptotaenium CS-1145]OJJ26530.1 copper-translocating P-type ATPase [Roseofilum reptotaenium AO1-A]